MDSREPLAAFSFYLSGRHQVLLAVADEVLANLDRCGADEQAVQAGQAGPRARASDLMWLWTLGAYEVTRTMCQARACFSQRFLADVTDLKADLERVRVPNTKMEKIKYDRKGATIPVGSDRGPDLWDAARKDLLVGDPADAVSARMLIRKYARVIASLRADEVLMRHEDAFTA